MSDTPRTDKCESDLRQLGKAFGEMMNETFDFARTLERENNQLRADLKQCAEALEYAGSHEHEGFDESNSHYNQSCSVCQKIDNALSLPSVQNALNGK